MARCGCGSGSAVPGCGCAFNPSGLGTVTSGSGTALAPYRVDVRPDADARNNASVGTGGLLVVGARGRLASAESVISISGITTVTALVTVTFSLPSVRYVRMDGIIPVLRIIGGATAPGTPARGWASLLLDGVAVQRVAILNSARQDHAVLFRTQQLVAGTYALSLAVELNVPFSDPANTIVVDSSATSPTQLTVTDIGS